MQCHVQMLSALFIAEEQGKWISVPVFWSSLYSSNLHGRKYKSLWTRLILSTTSKHKAVCLLSGSKSKLKTCSYSDIVICCRGGRVIEQLEGGRGEHAKHAPLSIHIFQCLLCTLQIWMFIKLLKQKHALYTYTCTTTWNNVNNILQTALHFRAQSIHIFQKSTHSTYHSTHFT